MGPAVSGFAEVGPALHGLRNVWSTMSAAGAGRPAKRARLEADKRRDALAEVEDKYADIDSTRFQKVVDIDTDAGGEATPPRFVLVRPVGTASVKDWRQWSSYEPDGAGETLSEEGLAHLCTTRRQRRHYTGPFGCTVQSNLPAPGQLLSKAGSAVQGRTALDKLRKQLAVMCLRIELQHFCGVSGDTIDAAALGRANSNASLVGGEGAVLTMEEATAWAPPAYPLVGDGLVFGGRSAHQGAVTEQDTIDLLLRKGAAIDKLQQAAAGAASSSAQEFLAALEVLASVINGATHVCDLEEGAGLRAHMDCLGLAPSSKIAMVPQPGGGEAVLLQQRNCFYNLTMAMLEQVARRAARLAHIDRRAMPAALREQRDATERKRLGFDAIEQALVRFVGAVYMSRKKSGKGILADAAAAALALSPSPSGAALQQEVVESILGAATTRITI